MSKELDQTLNKAKESLQKIKEKVDFLPVKGFSKYEFNGFVLRNKSTKIVQQIPKGKKNYYIFNDLNERKSIGLDALLLLIEVPKKTIVKNDGNENIKKHRQCYVFHLEGKSIEEISVLVGCPIPATKRNIWYYTSGKKTL